MAGAKLPKNLSLFFFLTADILMCLKKLNTEMKCCFLTIVLQNFCLVALSTLTFRLLPEGKDIGKFICCIFYCGIAQLSYIRWSVKTNETVAVVKYVHDLLPVSY